MSRLITFVVAMYMGVVLEQNFVIPTMPVPTQVIDKIHEVVGDNKPEPKKK